MTYDTIQQFNRTENHPLRYDALFSDGTADYRMPTEPEANQRVRIRFRSAKDNVDLVVLRNE